MKNIIGMVFVSMLFGCVTPYPVPKSVDAPTIMIEGSEISFLTMYENGENCSGLRKIPSEYNPFIEKPKPLPLIANKEVAFRLHYQGRDKYCALMLSFKPKEKYGYHLTYKKNSEICTALLTSGPKSSPSTRHQIDNSLKLRNETIAMTSEDAFCSEHVN